MTPGNRIHDRRSRLCTVSILLSMHDPLPDLTHEKIIGVRNIATDPEELHQVVELSVNVAAYLSRTRRISKSKPHRTSRLVSARASDRPDTHRHRRIHAHHVALFDQQLARLVAQLAHLDLRDGSTRAQLRDRSALRSETPSSLSLAVRALTCPGRSSRRTRAQRRHSLLTVSTGLTSLCCSFLKSDRTSARGSVAHGRRLCAFGPGGAVCCLEEGKILATELGRVAEIARWMWLYVVAEKSCKELWHGKKEYQSRLQESAPMAVFPTGTVRYQSAECRLQDDGTRAWRFGLPHKVAAKIRVAT